MVDNNIRDGAGAPDAHEHLEALNRLRNETLESLRRGGSDRLADNSNRSVIKELENPYNHIGSAGTALRELERIKGQAPQDKVFDTDGKPLDITVEAYRARLLKTTDEEFRLAVKAADVMAKSDKYAFEHNLPNVERSLQEVRKLESQSQSFDELLNLKSKESSLEARKHSASVCRCVYAEFLADSGDLASATKLYGEAGKIDPEARYDKDFQKLFADTEKKMLVLQQQERETTTEQPKQANSEQQKQANSEQQKQANFEQQRQADSEQASKQSASSEKQFNNPYAHYEQFTQAINKDDMKTARAEIEAAVSAAKGLDHDAIHKQRLAAEQELKEASDPDKIAELKQKAAMLNQFDHAEAFTKLILGEFELANKNYNTARHLFEEVKADDREFASRPNVKIDDLISKSEEPSFWQKTWSYTKDFLKDASCDAAAILAGAAAGALAIETGPGALVAAGAAGVAAYSGMKGLVYGEKVTLVDAGWGLADGLSGGGAALLRAGVVRLGEKTIAKEFAAKIVASGGATLETTQGGLTAARMGERLLGARLVELGKGMSFWERQAAKIGFGESAYRSAYWAQKGLKTFNLATSLGINATTAAGGSAIYRAAHDGSKYASGEYKSFDEFGSAYLSGVARDTVAGTFLGTIGSSTVIEPVSGLASKITGGSSAELISRLTQVAETSWNASSPRAFEALSAREVLEQTEEKQKELAQPPADDDEVQQNYSTLPQQNDDLSDWQNEK
jgi:hypothetical protein